SQLYVALGNGDGTFRAPTPVDGEGGNTLAVGDFHGDGKPDVAVRFGIANPAAFPGSARVLLGNGDGTFRRPLEYSLDHDYGQGTLLAGDVNGDGKVDLVAANDAGGSVSVLW